MTTKTYVQFSDGLKVRIDRRKPASARKLLKALKLRLDYLNSPVYPIKGKWIDQERAALAWALTELAPEIPPPPMAPVVEAQKDEMWEQHEASDKA